MAMPLHSFFMAQFFGFSSLLAGLLMMHSCCMPLCLKPIAHAATQIVVTHTHSVSCVCTEFANLSLSS